MVSRGGSLSYCSFLEGFRNRIYLTRPQIAAMEMLNGIRWEQQQAPAGAKYMFVLDSTPAAYMTWLVLRRSKSMLRFHALLCDTVGAT